MFFFDGVCCWWWYGGVVILWVEIFEFLCVLSFWFLVLSFGDEIGIDFVWKCVFFFYMLIVFERYFIVYVMVDDVGFVDLNWVEFCLFFGFLDFLYLGVVYVVICLRFVVVDLGYIGVWDFWVLLFWFFIGDFIVVFFWFFLDRRCL